MTFYIEVTYAPGNTDRRGGLTAAEAESALGAFSRDLLGLEGQGVAKVEIGAEV